MFVYDQMAKIYNPEDHIWLCSFLVNQINSLRPSDAYMR